MISDNALTAFAHFARTEEDNQYTTQAILPEEEAFFESAQKAKSPTKSRRSSSSSKTSDTKTPATPAETSSVWPFYVASFVSGTAVGLGGYYVYQNYVAEEGEAKTADVKDAKKDAAASKDSKTQAKTTPKAESSTQSDSSDSAQSKQ